MKKYVFCFLFINLFCVSNAQIDNNSFRVNTNGDVIMKRGTTDVNWKRALAINSLFNILYVNYNEDFSNGVRIFGKTSFDEITIDAITSSRIGFSTHDNFSPLGYTYSIANYGMTRIPNNIIAFSGYSGLKFFTNENQRMIITSNGNVGIGSTNPDQKLTVKGIIHASEIIVDSNVPADYVFQKYFTGTSELKQDYQMPTLSEVESYVKENNHLPYIPSAKEIQENGLPLGEMNNLLLQKIEELTLYIIEQNKRIDKLQTEIENFNDKGEL